MLRLEFTPADKATFNHDRYYSPHPRVRRKMETLWLKSEGLPPHGLTLLTFMNLNIDEFRSNQEISLLLESVPVK